MRLFHSSFYSSHFSVPALQPVPDTLLPSPNQPAWYSSPPLSRSSIPTCRCILRKPRSIPYQPVRRRVFFRARGEARKHGQHRIDEGGNQRIAILLLSVAPRRPIPDVHRRSRVSSFGRPRLHRQNKWTGQKGLGQRFTRNFDDGIKFF